MRSFSCPACRHLVFFENSTCLRCGTALGYCRAESDLVAADGHVYCANADVARCNWLVDAPGQLCGSCALTRTRPADADTAAMAAFADAEAAKRRLVFQLDDLGLPTDGVVFDLLSSAERPVTTGHADGVVTIDLAEGDDAHREALRVPARRALPHGAGPPAARDRALLLDGAGRGLAFAAIPGAVRRRARHYARGPANATTPPHARRVGGETT